MKTLATILAISGFAVGARADDQEADLAKQLSNPVASLISVPMQLNYDSRIGPLDAGYRVTLNVQPVIPISLGDEWNLIVRTIVPFISQHDVFLGPEPSFPGLPSDVRHGLPPALRHDAERAAERAFDRAVSRQPFDHDQSGLGDTTQSFFFSPAKPVAGWIVAAGPVFLYPTATDDLLGSEKWGAGVTVLALQQRKGWTYGVLANHIWSVAGDESRADISTSFVQPFVSYTTKTHTTFGLNAESTYDWNASQWTVPVNLSVSQVLKIGSQPVSVSLGGRYYADGPSGAPEWGARLVFTLLYPTGKHQPAPGDGKSFAK